MARTKYYRLDRIKEYKASYNMIVGERSNGKSYATLERGLERYFKEGKEIAYIRRWREDVTGANGANIFAGLVANNRITELSNGQWNSVYCYSGRYYLCKYKTGAKGETRITALEPFAYSFALNSAEHYKSNNYPKVGTVIFDEFIPINGVGLGDQEFMLFMNMLSTIIRDPSRTDVEVYMVANTVNWDSPYFREFGLGNVRNQKQGTIEYYVYGNSNCSLALEYCESGSTKESKEGDRFFAFNNPHLEMITTGAWEMDIYPHCPIKYRPKDIKFNYFVKYNDDLIQADVVKRDNNYFTYYHFKTTPIQDDKRDLIYSNVDVSPQFNKRVNLFKPTDNLGRRLLNFWKDNKVFFQDNIVGTIMNNYKEWCAPTKTGG